MADGGTAPIWAIAEFSKTTTIGYEINGPGERSCGGEEGVDDWGMFSEMSKNMSGMRELLGSSLAASPALVSLHHVLRILLTVVELTLLTRVQTTRQTAKVPSENDPPRR